MRQRKSRFAFVKTAENSLHQMIFFRIIQRSILITDQELKLNTMLPSLLIAWNSNAPSSKRNSHSLRTSRDTRSKHLMKMENVCELCDKSFCTSRLLKRHNNEVHKVSCTTCDETFTTKRALDIHIQREDSFTCGHCKKIFCN